MLGGVKEGRRGERGYRANSPSPLGSFLGLEGGGKGDEGEEEDGQLLPPASSAPRMGGAFLKKLSPAARPKAGGGERRGAFFDHFHWYRKCTSFFSLLDQVPSSTTDVFLDAT